jgi:hypothetical protein
MKLHRSSLKLAQLANSGPWSAHAQRARPVNTRPAWPRRDSLIRPASWTRHTPFFLMQQRVPHTRPRPKAWADIVACSSLFVCSDRMRFPVGQNRRAGAFQNPSSLSTLRPFLSSRNKRDEASAASEQRHHEPPQWRVRPPVGGRATVERLHGVANQ